MYEGCQYIGIGSRPPALPCSSIRGGPRTWLQALKQDKAAQARVCHAESSHTVTWTACAAMTYQAQARGIIWQYTGLAPGYPPGWNACSCASYEHA